MKRILSVFICICMLFTVQIPVGFAYKLNPAEGDILFEDDFSKYSADATSVDKSIAGWASIPNVANHKLITEDNGNRYLKMNATVEDSEAGISKQQYPAIYEVFSVKPGDTVAIAASTMVIDSSVNKATSYLQLRENTGATRRLDINNFGTGSISFCGEQTGYKAVSGKWADYEVYIKAAAKGSLSDVVMVMYGEGVSDANGNTVSKENPVVLRTQVSLDTMSIDDNGNVRALFNNNIALNNITNDSDENQAYTAWDNFVIYKAEGAFDGSKLSDLKVNGETVANFKSDTNTYDVKVAHDAESAVIEAVADGEGEIVIDNNNITEFPSVATVTVTNTLGLSSTYTLNLSKKRSETEVEAYLEKAYGGAESIISMTYDDGIYDTAVFLNEQFKKYDLRGSIMAITSRIEDEALRAKWLELLDDGYLDMQSHSSTHLVLPSDSWIESNGYGSENNTPENYQYELVDSKESLEEWVLNDVTGFAASNNTLSDGAWEVVRDTYYAARLGSRGYNTLDPQEGIDAGNWHNLKMQGFYDVSDTSASTKAEKIAAFADKAVENNSWLVTMCHGIKKDSGDAMMHEAEFAFRRIAQYVNENKIWCATFGDAIKYIRERQNSVAYADFVDNKVLVEVITDNTNIPAEIFNHPLTVKAQVPADWSMVSYSVGDKNETAKVFEENGLSWAYVNVLPNTVATVVDAGTSNKLESIAVNGIKIEGFDSETYEYSLLYSKDELPLAITTKSESADAKVTISSESITTLPATVTVTVTDGDGEELVYTLNLTRAPETDSTLKSLKVNGVDVEGFAAATYSYASEVNAAIATVAAEANSEYATVSIDKPTVDEFPATVNVTVTAEDNSTSVYTVVLSQLGGDEIILNDNFDTKTVGNTISSKNANSTVFAQGGEATSASGVKAVKDESTGNVYAQFYNGGTSANTYTSHAAYMTPGLTGKIVVKGKAMISEDNSSTHDIHIRSNVYDEDKGAYVSSTDVKELLKFGDGTIISGGKVVGYYTKGNWVNYTIAFEEDTTNSVYKTQIWVEGEEIKDASSNSVSGPLYASADIAYTFQSLANTDIASQRIVYRGVTAKGKTVELDDTKIYKQGNFHIKSASDSVDLDNGEKLNVKVNHDMAVQNVTADSITALTEDGISAKIASIEQVSTTEFNVVFDETTVAGEYTLSFGDTFTNASGAITSDTVKVTIKNVPEDVIILNEDFDSKTEGHFLTGKSRTSYGTKSSLGTSTKGAMIENSAVKFFNFAGGLQYIPTDVPLDMGITAPLVVKGKIMIPASDTDSSADIILRSQMPGDDGTYATDYGMPNIFKFNSNGVITFGSSNVAKFTKGKWVEYTVILRENKTDSTYSMQAWLGGDGILDADGNEVAEPLYAATTVKYDYESLSTTDAKINVRISYRGIIYASEDTTDSETTVFMDDWKIYTIGKFEVAEHTSAIDLTKTNKIAVKTNHDIDTKTLKKENIKLTSAENEAVITGVEKVSMTEFNIILDESTKTGDYTVSLNGVCDVAGAALEDTFGVKVEKITPAASVEVVVANGTVTAQIGDDTYDWDAMRTESFDVGTSITLTAVADNENEFMYWKDAVSKRIISREEIYSFVLGTDVRLEAVFASDASYFVTFTSANGKVLVASDTGEAVVPEAPYIGGYVFDGWYLDGKEQNLEVGASVTATERDLHYQAGFVKETTDYAVTLVNANEESGSYKYNDKVTVTAKDRSDEDLVFAYWKKGDSSESAVIVSYNSEYTFYVSGSVVVEAVYAQTASEKKEVISISARQIDSTRMGFFTEYDISEEYMVVETGILLSPNPSFNLETVGVIKATAISKNNKGQFTVRKKGISAGDTYYGRAYMIYTDGISVYTIYSEEIAATMN